MNEITFDDIDMSEPANFPSACSRCGAAVPKTLQVKHRDWHDHPNRID